MVLDVSLPDTDGFAVCHRLRRSRSDLAELRILMLTARSGLSDRIRGLDEGADDYVVKPFALGELLARIRALLRRDVSSGTAVLEVGELALDDGRSWARRGVRELALTRKEFAVLRYLMTRPGHVVSAEELLEHVWDENADPFTQTVRVTVGTLRRKLTVGGEDPLLETVIGRGYRLRDVPLQECLRRVGSRGLTDGSRPGPGPCAAAGVHLLRRCCSASPRLLLVPVCTSPSRNTVDAAPLDSRHRREGRAGRHGELRARAGEQFQAADLAACRRPSTSSTLADAARLLPRSRARRRCCMIELSASAGGCRAGCCARSERSPRPRARSRPPTCPAGSALTGPADELRTLADTIDAMLAAARRRVHRAAPAGRGRVARAAQPIGRHPHARGRRAVARRRDPLEQRRAAARRHPGHGADGPR